MVAPPVARIPNAVCERAMRTRGGVCVGQEVRVRVAGLSLPLCPFVPLLSPPFIRTYIYTCIRVREVCELSMVEQRFVLCAEGVFP